MVVVVEVEVEVVDDVPGNVVEVVEVMDVTVVGASEA
jgi:hypothetical protein